MAHWQKSAAARKPKTLMAGNKIDGFQQCDAMRPNMITRIRFCVVSIKRELLDRRNDQPIRGSHRFVSIRCNYWIRSLFLDLVDERNATAPRWREECT
mmetsp:Transcript_2727/g.5632  ORF Transcript_2727/g.5632 Transcript_2727/m.5632 type:complete len:98 (-) Transcript_2727:72-365(-)